MAENRGGRNKIKGAKKQAIFDKLKAGKGVAEIAGEERVSPTTVQKFRYEIKNDLPAWKAKTVAALTELHTRVVEDLRENYRAVPPGQKSILLGIITDKIRALSENEAQTVTHNHLHITHGDVNSLFADKPPQTTGSQGDAPEKLVN
tara:strand:+ start:1071 stop:1511 length:441 start_codon:yes stop_codon:yes gene_type:complete